jgi:hypothetical protein
MLYFKTIEPGCLELLKDLMRRDYLKQFVLVGGTSFALQTGHRMSFDLDMFSMQNFSSDNLNASLSQDYKLTTDVQMPQTLLCHINGIKVDFIRFKYEMQYPIVEMEGIRMLSINDIAPMKLDAITGRGRKRDFYDMYWILKKIDINTLLNMYLKMYPHQTTFHVVRSLSYFVDAEKDTDPIVFDKKVTWEKVKKAIIQEIRKI